MSTSASVITADPRHQLYPYFFTVAGIKGPYADWKKFKDLVRAIVPSNSPGWTNTGSPGSRPSGDTCGYFSVRTWEDACSAFAGLTKRRTDGSYWSVHLLDTSGTMGTQYRLIDCNCAALGYSAQGLCATYQKDRYYAAVTPTSGNTPYVAASNNDLFQQMSGPVRVSYAPPSHNTMGGSTAVKGVFSQAPTTAVTYNTTYNCNTSPIYYLRDVHGLAVNATHGLYVTECRSVLITNMNYSTKEAQLRDLLMPIARPVQIEMKVDEYGKNKGMAVVHFSSLHEVTKVIQKFSNFKFDGKHLRVRADRNPAAVQVVGLPVVVHSSDHQTQTAS